MKKFRFLSMLLTLSLVFGIFAAYTPIKAEAYDTMYGKITVTKLDNDFADGKYRFNYKFYYEDKYEKNEGIKLTNIKLSNSSGKKVLSWKDLVLLKNGGSHTQHFTLSFASLPSDTYKFSFNILPNSSYGYQDEKTFYTTVKHSAGVISYTSSKYFYDTNGNKKVQINFNAKQLKGYAPKYEVYDSNGKLVCTVTGPKYDSNDKNCYMTWGMKDNNGLKVPSGTYTFKITANGKSCTKKLNLNP